jgi:predicted TIM-barrel fold metal-dependent hydrolase
MKNILIKEKQFSKVICGTNAFYARSHFSEARDTEYRTRFDDDYIEKVIVRCTEFGVNAVESSANERIHQIIADLRRQHPIHFIGSTRIDKTSSMTSHQQKLKFLIDNRADICVIHAQFVDRPRATEEIRGLRHFVERIHDAGLIAGISTHRVSTVELCEDHDYGIDVYLFPLNMTGFVYPGYEGSDSVAERIRIIQSTPKTFILMKTLGAGRIPPIEGLRFVLENSKPSDIITLGLGSVEEAEESLSFVQEYLEKVT